MKDPEINQSLLEDNQFIICTLIKTFKYNRGIIF